MGFANAIFQHIRSHGTGRRQVPGNHIACNLQGAGILDDCFEFRRGLPAHDAAHAFHHQGTLNIFQILGVDLKFICAGRRRQHRCIFRNNLGFRSIVAEIEEFHLRAVDGALDGAAGNGRIGVRGLLVGCILTRAVAVSTGQQCPYTQDHNK